MRALVLLVLLPACAGQRAARRGMEEVAWDPKSKDEVRLDLVEITLEAGHPQQALDMIGVLRQEGVKGEQVDLLYARALFDQGLHHEALAALEAPSLRRDPERFKLEGLIWLEESKPVEAEGAFRRSLDHLPRKGASGLRSEVQNNLGFALAAQGRHAEAVEAYEAALRDRPSAARTRNNLGFSLVALGEDKRALSTFQAAQDQRQELPLLQRQANAHYNLGLGRQLRGDADGARESYDRALELNPDHVQAAEALASLLDPQTDHDPEDL